MEEMDYEQYYSVERLEGEMSSPIQQARHRKVAERCEGKVLDAGGGVGTLGNFLEKDQYFAIDIKPDYVQHINGKGFEAKLGDIRSLQFPDESFDTVVAGEILEHLPNPGEALKECCRVAKKKVILTLPLNMDEEWHLWRIEAEILEGQFLLLELQKKDGGE